MIERISFHQADKPYKYSYVAELESVQNLNKEIEFTDGLNIIIGPNGSGKSSILNVISHQLAANITGVSMLSKSWLRSVDFGSIMNKADTPLSCADIRHDGRPIFYCSPRQGISGMVNSLDENEFGLEVALDQFNSCKESTGEKSNRLLTPFMEAIINTFDHPESIHSMVNVNSINDHWQDNLENVVNAWFLPSIPLGKPTLVLDEPETGLSILNQILLWKKVLTNPSVLARYQIILVSHSHESINVPGANYIELKPGYLEACRKAMRGEIDLQEAQNQATKLIKPLNKRQHDLLIKIKTSPGSVVFTDSKTQNFLLEKELIDVFQMEEKNESKRKNGRFPRSFKFKPTYCCHLTALGHQYLSLHT